MARRSSEVAARPGPEAPLKVDDHVAALGGGAKGIIRFLGSVHFAEGEWAGIELTDGEGKNNGTVQGKSYFTCKDKAGIFLRPTKLLREESSGGASTKANGVAVPRAAAAAAASAPVAAFRRPVATAPSSPAAAGAADAAQRSAQRQSVASAKPPAPADVALPPAQRPSLIGRPGKRPSTASGVTLAKVPAVAVRTAAEALVKPPVAKVPDRGIVKHQLSVLEDGDDDEEVPAVTVTKSEVRKIMPSPPASPRPARKSSLDCNWGVNMMSEPTIVSTMTELAEPMGPTTTLTFRGHVKRKLIEEKAPPALLQRAQKHLFAIKASRPEAKDGQQRPAWRLGEWIASQIDGVLTQAFLESMGTEDEDMELAFVKALGDVGTEEVIVNIIKQDAVLFEMAHVLLSKARELTKAAAATGEELNGKFTAESGTFMMNYGTLADFSKGLESLIGSPDANLLKAMEKEHCNGPDADEFWTTGNYGITTTPRLEWFFVMRPDDGLNRLKKLGVSTYSKLKEWPKETMNSAHPRVGANITDFKRQTWDINCRLGNGDEKRGIKAMGEKTIMLEEFIGIRLYTGPMFEKYNAVNRGGALQTVNGQAGLMQTKWKNLCMGNRYVTTIHVINSGLIKLNKLSTVCTVYRGLSGGLLPEAFWKPNEFGARAAVEFGFTSTTTNRAVAMSYASGKGAGTVLEIKTGAIDRGADISMLSQYPHEKEICFPPLTSLEVLGTRVEGTVLVVEVRINVNMAALTVEEVVAKRQKLVKDMAGNLKLEIRSLYPNYGDCEGMFQAISDKADKELDDAAGEKKEFYNKDTNLLEKLNYAISVKEAALDALDFVKAANDDSSGTSMKSIAHKAPLVVKALRMLSVKEEHFAKEHAKEMHRYFTKVHEQAENLQRLSVDLSSTNDRTKRQGYKDFTKTVLQQRDLARLAWDLAGDKVMRALRGEGLSGCTDELEIEKAEPKNVQAVVVEKTLTLLKDVVKNRFSGMKWLRGFDKVSSALVCTICKANVKNVESLAVGAMTARDLRFKVEVPVTVFLLLDRKTAPSTTPAGLKQANSVKEPEVEASQLAAAVGVPKDFEPTGEEPLKGVDETRGKLWDIYKRDFQPGWVSFECPFTAYIFVSATDSNYEWRVLACQLLQGLGAEVSDRPEVLAHLLKFGPMAGIQTTDLTVAATKALDALNDGFVSRAMTLAEGEAAQGNVESLKLLMTKKNQLTPSLVPGRCQICREEGGDCPGNWATVIMQGLGLTKEMVTPQQGDARGEMCKRFRNFWIREDTQRARQDAITERMLQAVLSDNVTSLQLLMTAKASPDVRDADASLVYVAAEANRCEVLKALLEAGAPFKGKPAAAKGGKSPVFAAAASNRLEALALLLEKKADVDEANDSGVTPVHMAARNNHLDVIGQLLAENANTNAEANSGKTPLDFAQEAGHKEVATMLTEHGGVSGSALKQRNRSQTVEFKNPEKKQEAARAVGQRTAARAPH